LAKAMNKINEDDIPDKKWNNKAVLENEDVLALASDGYNVAQIASTLNSHINLLLIKMQEMNKIGFDFNVSYRPKSNIFKDLSKK
jgi:hypothetical protein